MDRAACVGFPAARKEFSQKNWKAKRKPLTAFDRLLESRVSRGKRFFGTAKTSGKTLRKVLKRPLPLRNKSRE
jgi:hypothetical protein